MENGVNKTSFKRSCNENNTKKHKSNKLSHLKKINKRKIYHQLNRLKKKKRNTRFSLNFSQRFFFMFCCLLPFALGVMCFGIIIRLYVGNKNKEKRLSNNVSSSEEEFLFRYS